MTAKIAIIAIFVSALVAGAAMYYLQVFYYYEDVSGDLADISMTPVDGGAPVAIGATDIRAIDANSSPIRFRACFTAPEGGATLAETYATAPSAVPLNAPFWFDCFDAEAIGDALEAGGATALMGIKNVVYGIDRVAAVFPDGRGYSWHQINECGEVVFNGEPAPESCPTPPEGD